MEAVSSKASGVTQTDLLKSFCVHRGEEQGENTALWVLMAVQEKSE